MNLDLKLLICSYLELEEILNLNRQIRDLILKRYKYEFPSWNEILKSNNYIVAGYLMEIGSYRIFKSNSKLDLITYDLKMLNLLYTYHYKFTIHDLNTSAFKGKFDIFMYFISIGIEPTADTLEYVENGYELLDNLLNKYYEEDERSYRPLEGYLKIMDYLKNE